MLIEKNEKFLNKTYSHQYYHNANQASELYRNNLS